MTAAQAQQKAIEARRRSAARHADLMLAEVEHRTAAAALWDIRHASKPTTTAAEYIAAQDLRDLRADELEQAREEAEDAELDAQEAERFALTKQTAEQLETAGV